jgi:filamentous hemagglutinin family protein
MNRIFRTLWSVATQSWQAVPETAKTAGKKSTSSASGVVASVALSFTLTGGAGAQSPPAINQLPTAGTVVRGAATISQTATAQAAAMTVNQTSQRAVVNWDTFNVGSTASVNFVQPNAQAVILNRVNDSNPSQIFGRITSNGQVFLSNANGVYFSTTSSIDVGAITATTHSISNDNFMSGNYVFERNGATGKVVNEGRINAALGGYVALLAPEVQNTGVVVARAGTVAMAAGEMITLNMGGAGSLAGITTTPSAIATLIENKQAVQAPDGQIILSAMALNKLQAGVIKNSGSLEANSLVNKGGKIYLEADDITLASTSQIEAKGATGGGTVLVGGDWQGSGDMRQATKVSMAAGATIDASATDKGDGGKIVLWSNVHHADSHTLIAGTVNAEGRGAQTRGGQIETSGAKLDIADSASIRMGGVGATGGRWLLDPVDFTIAAIGGNITGTALGSSITAGSTVEIFNTSGTTGTAGNINVNANVSWNNSGVLKLTASGGVTTINSSTISMGTGGGGLIFNQAGTSTYSGVISGNGSVTKDGVGTLTLSGANTYTGATNLNNGTLTAGANTVAGTSSSFGNNSAIVIANNPDALLDVSSRATQVGSLSGYGKIKLGSRDFTFGADNSDGDFSGVIYGGGGATVLFKKGTGIQTLSGLSSFAQNININQGTLKLGNAGDGTYSPLGTSTGSLSISSGAALDLNGYTLSVTKALTLNSKGINNTGGGLKNTGTAEVTWTGVWSQRDNASIATSGGRINLAGSGALGNSGATTYSIDLEGYISIGGSIGINASTMSLATNNTVFEYSSNISVSIGSTISGPGRLIANLSQGQSLIMASATNSYSGGTIVKSGILKLPNSNNVLKTYLGTGSVTVENGATLDINGSNISNSLYLSGSGVNDSGAISNSANGAGTASGLITLNGDTKIFGGINAGTTGAALTANSHYLTLDGNTNSNSYLYANMDSGGIIKQGTNYWFLNGSNTIPLGVTVNAGQLTASSAASLGTSGPITVNSGGGLNLSFISRSSSPFSRDITISGFGLTTNAGALQYMQGAEDFYYAGNLTLNGTANISEGLKTIHIMRPVDSNGFDIYTAKINQLVVPMTGGLLSGGGTVKDTAAYVGGSSGTSNYGDTATVASQIYTTDAATATLAIQTTGSAVFTANGTAINALSAGSYSLSYSSGLSSANYAFFPITTKTAWTITPKPITITNNAASTTYDGTSTYASLVANSGFTTSAALVGSDAIGSLTQTLTNGNGAVSGIAQAGTFTSMPSAAVFSSGNLNNYSISYAAATNTVAKANLSIFATPSLTGNVYSGQAYTASYTLNALGNDASSITVTGLATGTNVGTYTSALSATGDVLSNYNTPSITNANLVIDPQPLTQNGQVTTNNADITALIGRQLAELTGSQIGRLSNSKPQEFSEQQLAALHSSQFFCSNGVQIDSICSVQPQGIRPAQVALLAPAQLADLSADQIASFSTPQLQALTAAQVNAIAPEQLSALSAAQISLLTGNTAAPLSFSQVFALSPNQVAAMQPAQLSRMTAAEVGSFSDAQLQALTPAQIAAISPTSFGALGAEQIMVMSSTQLQSLSPEQLASFTPLQVASLSTDVLTAAAPDVTRMSGLEIRALTPEQLNALPSQQVANLKPAQLQALTTTQLSQFTPEQVDHLSPAQLAVMSPRQLQALPTTPVTAVDATPSTGVLAVTILQNASSKPVSTGIAFEQDENTISLKVTAAPATLAISEKVVFSDKLTTFLVATSDGEMVEFQGSLVNNRMVIVAQSDASKKIARTEMNLVIAAAVTSLGKDNRVMLANLESVVLDLR